jgi:TonB family protein
VVHLCRGAWLMSATFADSTLAGEAPRPRARLIDAFVVAADDTFTLELGPLIGARFRARPVERLEDIESVGSTRWLALIDGSAANAHGLVHQIEQQHARAPLIAVVEDGQQGQWSSALARGSVIAVVLRSNLAGPALQHALTDAERRLGIAVAAAAAPASAGATKTPPAAGGSIKYFVAAALLLLLSAGWYFLRGSGVTPPSGPVAPATAATGTLTDTAGKANADVAAAEPVAGAAAVPALQRRPVLDLLSLARVAFRDSSRLLPRDSASKRGDSAIELYAEVLAQDPSNAEARDGVRRLFSVARSRLQSDLNAGRIDEAQRMLALFAAAGVAAESTKSLQADIKAAEPKWYLSQLRRALNNGDLSAAEQYYAQLAASGTDRSTLQDIHKVMDARAADVQLQSMGADVRAAIDAGALIDPTAGSARTRLMAMRQLNRTHAATTTAQKNLQEALLTRARDALQAQQMDSAQRWLTAAAEFGNSAELGELRKRAQDQTEQVTARVTAAAAAAAAPVSAPAATPTAPRFVTARAVRPLSVTYPARASAAGTSGYVIVEFTLNANGGATTVGVVESQPAGVFDKAATDAVARGRFDTSVLGTDKQPTRARLRLTFKPS